MTAGIPCRTVFLDAGGVIVLPHRGLVAGALRRIGIEIDPDAVPRAHYRAVRAFDRAGGSTPSYLRAFISGLGIPPSERSADALGALEALADRNRSGQILWSEPTPGALETITALRRRRIPVVIVTNSDGHAEENLRHCGFDGVSVIDSVVVGSEKPDVRIFEAALARARAGTRAGTSIRATDVVHVGDTLSADVAGARAAGITPIHFDPRRACRARDHRHIRTLPGIWQHIAFEP